MCSDYVYALNVNVASANVLMNKKVLFFITRIALTQIKGQIYFYLRKRLLTSTKPKI